MSLEDTNIMTTIRDINDRAGIKSDENAFAGIQDFDLRPDCYDGGEVIPGSWMWLGRKQAAERSRKILGRLVGNDTESFLSTSYGLWPQLFQSQGSASFNDLLSISDVSRLVGGMHLKPPAVRMVKEGRLLSPQSYLRSAIVGGVIVDDLPDARLIGQALAGGATLKLQGLHQFWPPLTRQCDAMSVALSHYVKANAYLTPPRSIGLGRHYDTHDVFVLQAEGSKSWRIWEPVVAWPLASQEWTDVRSHNSSELPVGKLVLEVTLEPGDTLYVPRGFVHAVASRDAPSLHLTLGVLASTWVEALKDSYDAVARSSVEHRMPLPAGFALNSKSRSEAVVEYERIAAEKGATPESAIGAAERAFWRNRAEDLSSHIADVLEREAVSELTTVFRRPSKVLQIGWFGERFMVRSTKRELSVPGSWGREIIELLDGSARTAGSLEPGRGTADKVQLVKRLVQEGFLSIGAGAEW